MGGESSSSRGRERLKRQRVPGTNRPIRCRNARLSLPAAELPSRLPLLPPHSTPSSSSSWRRGSRVIGRERKRLEPEPVCCGNLTTDSVQRDWHVSRRDFPGSRAGAPRSSLNSRRPLWWRASPSSVEPDTQRAVPGSSGNERSHATVASRCWRDRSAGFRRPQPFRKTVAVRGGGKGRWRKERGGGESRGSRHVTENEKKTTDPRNVTGT